MIGVRRGFRASGLIRAVTIRLIAPALAALIVHQGGVSRAFGADERAPTSRPAGTPSLKRGIKQTTAPGQDDEEAAIPGEVPRRKKLTGLDPEIENLTEPLVDVVIEGNKTIHSDEIVRKIKTRPGRAPDPKMIQEDVKTLLLSRWFFQVVPRIARTKTGPVLVFKVVERPVLMNVEYKGNKKIKTKELTELTNLRVGGAFEVGANKESVHRIESLYHDKGYIYAKVELEKGSDPDDREVIFKITEGPKVHVDSVIFEGNKEISSGVLKTQLKTKTRKLWLFGGKFDPTTIPEDIYSLKEYYKSLGYFDVKITANRANDEDEKGEHSGSVVLVYEIHEGERFKVRNIEFVGNRVIPAEKLVDGMKQKESQYFNDRYQKADVAKMIAQYGDLGRIQASVDPAVRFLDEDKPGEIDLVYHINEDRPYRIGKIHVNINGDHPHTKESVVLTRLLFKPGDLASREKIEKSKQRLMNSQCFAGATPGSHGGPEITVSPRPTPIRKYDSDTVARGQNYGGGVNSPPSSSSFDDPGFGPGFPGAQPYDSYYDDTPNYADTIVNVSETQTGRLMFGVGVNSNAGLLGNIVLEENNFDITRFPKSPTDWTNAFRGGGQQFRIEATPGNQLSRYLVSWRDPYFLYQNVSLGLSGFYYQRFFPSWTEQRTGGGITVGQQFSPYLSGSLKLRLEDVFMSNPAVPTPDALQQVLGSNFLSTIRGNIVHDTRDSAFIPGSGHYLELAYEQGFAEFVYPRVDVDARQFWTLRERPDGGNRHILSTHGQFGWMDSGAPMFENYFPGGFQSFRGFAFYGVGPSQFGVHVGGRFQALGTVEYMLPVTADDSIQIVTFTDMGTADTKIMLDNFRMTVGVGVRLTIPAMGPLPIALDLGFPIRRLATDTENIFAFYVGAQR